MNVVIREIGNSKGIIIPASVLKEAGIGRVVDMRVEDDCIIVQAAKDPRAGWLEAIQKDPPDEDESVFMDGIEDADLEEDWTW